MTHEIFEINKWELASPEWIHTALKNKDVDEAQYSHYRWDNHSKVLSPVSLYKFLKAKFGEPNGISMLFTKKGTTDNLIHWHYSFHIGGSEIHFWGKSAGIEISIKIPVGLDFKESDWQELITGLKESFAEYGKQMNAVQEGFDKYTLFINPFTRLNDTLSQVIAELKRLDIEEIGRVGSAAPEDKRKEYWEKYNKWIHSVERAVTLGTTVRMLSPVLAESFINTLLFILCKKEYKEDKRLYSNLIRDEIDIRVKTFHITCDGFAKAIDANRDEFKNFHTLMNGRNDFLHGNIDPTKLTVEEVFLDQESIPLFKDDEGIITKTMRGYLTNIEPQVAIRDFFIVHEFISFVFEHLQEDLKKPIAQMLLSRLPSINNKTNGITILFSPSILAEGYVH